MLLNVVLPILMGSCFLGAQVVATSDVNDLIVKLGYDSSDRQINTIASYRQDIVVPLLLRELRVVDVPVVYEDGAELNDLPSFTSVKMNDLGIHVIMCIRVLESISSRKFTASSKFDFRVDIREDPDLEDRIGLIQATVANRKCYNSYYHWVSHLKYFLPPVQAQKKIISKWHSWWKAQNCNNVKFK